MPDVVQFASNDLEVLCLPTNNTFLSFPNALGVVIVEQVIVNTVVFFFHHLDDFNSKRDSLYLVLPRGHGIKCAHAL